MLVSADGVAKLTEFDYSILYEGTTKFRKTNQTSLGTLRWMVSPTTLPKILNLTLQLTKEAAAARDRLLEEV